MKPILFFEFIYYKFWTGRDAYLVLFRLSASVELRKFACHFSIQSYMTRGTCFYICYYHVKCWNARSIAIIGLLVSIGI